VSDHLTRKELTQDNVALKVGESVHFLGVHKKQIVRYGGAALALIVVVGLGFYYRDYFRDQRQQALADAIALQSAPVGAPPQNGGPSFPNEDAKKSGVVKAYQKVLSDHGGSTEGYIAEFFLAGLDIEAGKMADARKKYSDVAAGAESNYASLAKLALAEISFSEGKAAEARTLLKDLADHPTALVSKNQADFTLAKGIMSTDPAEARKLLVALAETKTDVAQPATAALGELQP
jgi:predicted negative regulator of RcsB-dependent stress response